MRTASRHSIGTFQTKQMIGAMKEDGTLDLDPRKGFYWGEFVCEAKPALTYAIKSANQPQSGKGSMDISL